MQMQRCIKLQNLVCRIFLTILPLAENWNHNLDVTKCKIKTFLPNIFLQKTFFEHLNISITQIYFCQCYVFRQCAASILDLICPSGITTIGKTLLTKSLLSSCRYVLVYRGWVLCTCTAA